MKMFYSAAKGKISKKFPGPLPSPLFLLPPPSPFSFNYQDNSRNMGDERQKIGLSEEKWESEGRVRSWTGPISPPLSLCSSSSLTSPPPPPFLTKFHRKWYGKKKKVDSSALDPQKNQFLLPLISQISFNHSFSPSSFFRSSSGVQPSRREGVRGGQDGDRAHRLRRRGQPQGGRVQVKEKMHVKDQFFYPISPFNLMEGGEGGN